MTHVNIQEFTTLKEQVQKAKEELPAGSLDWSIYQNQLELLEKVEKLFDTYITYCNGDAWGRGKA